MYILPKNYCSSENEVSCELKSGVKRYLSPVSGRSTTILHASFHTPLHCMKCCLHLQSCAGSFLRRKFKPQHRSFQIYHLNRIIIVRIYIDIFPFFSFICYNLSHQKRIFHFIENRIVTSGNNDIFCFDRSVKYQHPAIVFDH